MAEIFFGGFREHVCLVLLRSKTSRRYCVLLIDADPTAVKSARDLVAAAKLKSAYYLGKAAREINEMSFDTATGVAGIFILSVDLESASLIRGTLLLSSATGIQFANCSSKQISSGWKRIVVPPHSLGTNRLRRRRTKVSPSSLSRYRRQRPFSLDFHFPSGQ